MNRGQCCHFLGEFGRILARTRRSKGANFDTSANGNIPTHRQPTAPPSTPHMPRRSTARPAAGSASAAAAALKGRAANQPSCYVNVGSNGTSMNTNYLAPPPGTLPTGATVENLAQGSTYFQDLAAVDSSNVEEPTEDVLNPNLLANFLQIRGPSFGPNYSSGNQQGSLVTPSLTRTIDQKVFKRAKQARHQPKKEEADDDDDEYSDDDDSFEEEDSEEDEDEPFVGGGRDRPEQQHPASSYSTTLAQDAKKEQDKQMLLAQAFAYVTRVERENERQAKLDERRERQSHRKGKQSSNKYSSNKKGGRGAPRQQHPKKTRQRQRQPKPRQPKPRNGAARDQAQARLYGKKKTSPTTTTTNNPDINPGPTTTSTTTTTISSSFSDPPSADILPSTANDIEQQLQKALDRHNTKPVPQQVRKQPPSAPSSTVLQNTYVNIDASTHPTKKTTKHKKKPSGAKTNKNRTKGKTHHTATNVGRRNNENNENNENNALEATESIADHFLSFQPPTTEGTTESTTATALLFEQQALPPTLTSDNFLRRGSNKGRPTASLPNGRRGRGGGKRPNARERPPQTEANMFGDLNHPHHNNNNREEEEEELRRVPRKRGELSQQEMDSIVQSFESGSGANRLRKELEKTNHKITASEVAFRKAQEEFKMLL